MPQPTRNEPDAIDLQNMLGSIGEEFHAVVYFVVRMRNDKWEVMAKAIGAPYGPDDEVIHVALQNWPITQSKNWNVVYFTLAFDLWLQFDGGGATAAKRGVTYDWRGRVEVPRRRRAK